MFHSNRVAASPGRSHAVPDVVSQHCGWLLGMIFSCAKSECADLQPPRMLAQPRGSFAITGLFCVVGGAYNFVN